MRGTVSTAFAGGLIGVLGSVGILTLAGCSGPSRDSGTPAPNAGTPSRQGETPNQPPGGQSGGEPGALPVPRVLGTVADHLDTPWGLAFLPDGSALVAERDTARIVRVSPGDPGRAGGSGGTTRALGVVPGVRSLGKGNEAGLLGLAVSGSTAYVYYTSRTDNRVAAIPFSTTGLGTPRVILTGIPSGPIHNGGRLAFGPDGFLYVSTGEGGVGSRAQDRASLGGKILRITRDGRPAPGNPFGDSPVWTYGHRNVQGLAFDPRKRLWASEFGQNSWDELNLIRPGRNYGWPIVEGMGEDPRFTNPLHVWPTSQASPSGLAYAQGALWMPALRGERLWRIPIADGRVAGAPTAFFVGSYGRLRSAAVAPDGTLWVTTSNTDGRGDPKAGDDRILRIRLAPQGSGR